MLTGVTIIIMAVVMLAPGAQAQSATSPYNLNIFPGTPPAGATRPDDLAISANGKHLWVGNGNGVDTTGKGGPSTLVEYDIASGAVLKAISIPAHLDGLKINPATGDVWATENEDSNPTLAVVDHESGTFNIYRFDPTLITGGMDDLVFVTSHRGGSRHDSDSSPNVYIVTSSQADTTTPVIVRISGPLRATNTQVTSALPGAPQSVLNVVTNRVETTDMIGDPDSMTIDPAGDLVLDNRSDDSLYVMRDPKAQNRVLRVPLTLGGNAVEVDDTIFTWSETTRLSSTARATKRWRRVSSALDPRTRRATSKPRRITSWTGVRIGGLSVTADGKYLALLKGPTESGVYVGELEANGTRLMNPRRLTLDERDDEPSAWTLDGKAVLFDSNRNGSFDIFRQALDQRTAEL